ncbi:MAG: galactitol-1-phosphate 5-dehydrogenase [Lachnospiraceae bacterium]|nr:galactitol-1-phosphate 5-dehydrogenase [Lachnospiraceae bacterium]
MKAWVLEDIGKILFQEIERPVPADNEVLVRVRSCGICGSDVPRIYKDGAHRMPLVIGHEFSGEVEETGKGASRSWLGKRVGIFPLIPCKKCGPCKKGLYEMCRNYGYLGSRRDGGFAEYVSVPVWNLIELPENLSFRQAAMLEPMAVARHAIGRVEPKPGDKVSVYGQGTIGLFLLMLLIEQGIQDIFVFANHDIQKQTAAEFGLPKEHICDTRTDEINGWIAERTDGNGFDASFDAIGSNVIYSMAVENSAPGGRVCLMGNPASDMSLKRDIYWKILRNQLKLFGTWNSSFEGRSDNRRFTGEQGEKINSEREKRTEGKGNDWKEILSLLCEERICPERVITHCFGIGEIDRGFRIMRDKSEEYIKIMMRDQQG